MYTTFQELAVLPSSSHVVIILTDKGVRPSILLAKVDREAESTVLW
jgi:hypothetical protein